MRQRFPLLFHVTDRAALPGIARLGLLPAAALARLAGRDVSANRDGWVDLAVEGQKLASLRRQGMGDGALASRLAPGLTPATWRAFINGMVFLFVTETAARGFRGAEPGRDQVVIAWERAALEAAGCDLRGCRFNNGYIDRSPAAKRRLRGPADYLPLAGWTGAAPREVAVMGGIPPGLPFRPLP